MLSGRCVGGKGLRSLKLATEELALEAERESPTDEKMLQPNGMPSPAMLPAKTRLSSLESWLSGQRGALKLTEKAMSLIGDAEEDNGGQREHAVFTDAARKLQLLGLHTQLRNKQTTPEGAIAALQPIISPSLLEEARMATMRDELTRRLFSLSPDDATWKDKFHFLLSLPPSSPVPSFSPMQILDTFAGHYDKDVMPPMPTRRLATRAVDLNGQQPHANAAGTAGKRQRVGDGDDGDGDSDGPRRSRGRLVTSVYAEPMLCDDVNVAERLQAVAHEICSSEQEEPIATSAGSPYGRLRDWLNCFTLNPISAMTLLYKSSRDSFEYPAFLDRSHDASGSRRLLLVRDGDTHLLATTFGNGGDAEDDLEPEDSTAHETTDCPVAFYTISGVCDTPSKIMASAKGVVAVAGRDGVVPADGQPFGNVYIGRHDAALLWLGGADNGPAADLSSCLMVIETPYLPRSASLESRHIYNSGRRVSWKGSLASSPAFTAKEIELWALHD
ncbi:unnamed protein product [Vitrella brassicaformis CCMP3155]|uniref:TLDc domain-containing protein n=1 Tax=Vitrella brassicaformis (strain CCMP3155) TaxID=1169540 RepID=A0A0G4GFS8_VITBC|nr:unnamed protein product [Vitrella brassicaformis CCMP3155]|eukprot:CEM28163.1 unnamed protein product [Vitrella brassicaformis CCMP3155]